MTAAVEHAWRLAERGAPSPRSIERALLTWFKGASAWVRAQLVDARRGATPAVLATRIRVARGLRRPPSVEALRSLTRPALRAAVRGELGVLRAAGLSREDLERRLALPNDTTPPGRVRADAAPRGRPALGTSGVVDVWADGPGRRVLDDWARVVRAHTVELSEGYVKALVKAIGEGIANGGEWEDVASAVAAVSERFGNKVRLLARDEIAALTSAVTRELQTQAGITHFRWVNRGDAKVRPTHEAAAVIDEGHGPGVYPWTQGAPGVGLYGEPGYPGQIRNCRCKARPVLPEDLRRGPARARLPDAEFHREKGAQASRWLPSPRVPNAPSSPPLDWPPNMKWPPPIDYNQQNKHVSGTQPWSAAVKRPEPPSELLVNPEGLAVRAGGGTPMVPNLSIGQAGYKERVNFGVVIGRYNGAPTTWGMLVYDKRGRIHIIPTDPNSW